MLYPNMKELIALKALKSRGSMLSQRAVKSTAPGNHHSPFRGQGLEFDSVREYVLGDDIRNIDWRVTARSGSPHIKLFNEEKERSVLLCVDMNAHMRFGTRNTFKSVQAARVAATLGWQSLAQHDRVGTLLFGDVPLGMQFFEPCRTRKSLWSTLKAFVEPCTESHPVPLESALEHLVRFNHVGLLIYVISDFLELTVNLERSLIRLNKRCDVVAVSINDQAEKSIPALATISFHGENSEIILANTDSFAGREAYAAKWEENRQKLSQMMNRQKIPLVQLTTEADIPRDLIFGLNRISKRRGK